MDTILFMPLVPTLSTLCCNMVVKKSLIYTQIGEGPLLQFSGKKVLDDLEHLKNASLFAQFYEGYFSESVNYLSCSDINPPWMH